MRKGTLAVTLLFACLFAVVASAQEMSEKKNDTIFFIYQLTPKMGMAGKFEEAFKQHKEWRKQQGDTMTWIVAEIMTGENAGSYLVRTNNTTWGNFDTYDVPGWLQNYEENVSPYMEKFNLKIMRVDKELQNLPPDNSYYNFIQLEFIDVNYDKMMEFWTAVKAFHEALQAGNAPFYYQFLHVASGDQENRVVLAMFHQSFASFNTPDKGPYDYLVAHIGEQKAKEMAALWNNAIKKSSTQLIHVRPDMSLMQPQQ